MALVVNPLLKDPVGFLCMRFEKNMKILQWELKDNNNDRRIK